MESEKADLDPTPAETDSAQTNESVEISKSENRVEKVGMFGLEYHESDSDDRLEKVALRCQTEIWQNQFCCLR